MSKSRRRKTPVKKGKGDYNGPLTEEETALMWVLAEEDKSQRAIAEELGRAPSTISRAMAKDPVASEALKARLREERAKAWKGLRAKGITAADLWLDNLIAGAKKLLAAGKPVRKGKARRARGISAKELQAMSIVPRCVSSAAMAAEKAEKVTQLLTGGATERFDDPGGGADAKWTSEQAIESALATGDIDCLPPQLQAIARAEQARRNGQGAPGA